MTMHGWLKLDCPKLRDSHRGILVRCCRRNGYPPFNTLMSFWQTHSTDLNHIHELCRSVHQDELLSLCKEARARLASLGCTGIILSTLRCYLRSSKPTCTLHRRDVNN